MTIGVVGGHHACEVCACGSPEWVGWVVEDAVDGAVVEGEDCWSWEWCFVGIDFTDWLGCALVERTLVFFGCLGVLRVLGCGLAGWTLVGLLCVLLGCECGDGGA